MNRLGGNKETTDKKDKEKDEDDDNES